jgi:NAD(P)-dependent dehydrogenase (short-subunit alcohol dehydrogenase family)
MSTIVITGAAGGIGAATRQRLEADGHRVIGVDVRDVEVVADLATAEGRDAMVAEVLAACDGVLDGLVAGAGTMNDDFAIPVNYLGAVAALEGLRPALAASGKGKAVAISSNSITTTPGLPDEIARALLDGDASTAQEIARKGYALAYAGSKLALARWVRRNAVTDPWIGKGINLNAICPGVIETPMTEGQLDFIFGIPDVFPIPIARPGAAQEVAGLLAYLLSPDAGFFVGSVLFMDGGSDAATRADDWPAVRAH